MGVCQSKAPPSNPKSAQLIRPTNVSLFRDAASRQRSEGGQSGAEFLHGVGGIHPAFWGVSKEQIGSFLAAVRTCHQDGSLSNPSRAECQSRGIPHYPDAK